jgi:hypothetical protein
MARIRQNYTTENIDAAYNYLRTMGGKVKSRESYSPLNRSLVERAKNTLSERLGVPVSAKNLIASIPRITAGPIPDTPIWREEPGKLFAIGNTGKTKVYVTYTFGSPDGVNRSFEVKRALRYLIDTQGNRFEKGQLVGHGLKKIRSKDIAVGYISDAVYTVDTLQQSLDDLLIRFEYMDQLTVNFRREQ